MLIKFGSRSWPKVAVAAHLLSIMDTVPKLCNINSSTRQSSPNLVCSDRFTDVLNWMITQFFGGGIEHCFWLVSGIGSSKQSQSMGKLIRAGGYTTWLKSLQTSSEAQPSSCSVAAQSVCPQLWWCLCLLGPSPASLQVTHPDSVLWFLTLAVASGLSLQLWPLALMPDSGSDPGFRFLTTDCCSNTQAWLLL